MAEQADDDLRGLPATLDVRAVPPLAPETQNDPEVIAFVADQGRKAKYRIGVCNGVALLGAAGLLKGKRVRASVNALSLLPKLGAAEVVSTTRGVVVDGDLYTARLALNGAASSPFKRAEYSRGASARLPL